MKEELKPLPAMYLADIDCEEGSQSAVAAKEISALRSRNCGLEGQAEAQADAAQVATGEAVQLRKQNWQAECEVATLQEEKNKLQGEMNKLQDENMQLRKYVHKLRHPTAQQKEKVATLATSLLTILNQSPSSSSLQPTPTARAEPVESLWSAAEGDPVQSNYEDAMGGSNWYDGVVAAVNEDKTIALSFVNGHYESRVPIRFVRPRED